MYDEGMVHNNHPLIMYLPVYLIVIFFLKSCQKHSIVLLNEFAEETNWKQIFEKP